MDDIRRALLIDTETSGLDRDAELIELGCVLYSVQSQSTLMEFSTLVPASGNPSEQLNRIPLAALREITSLRFAPPDHTVVSYMLANADVLCSYNVEFDARFFDPAFYLSDMDWPWLCAMSDFQWPRQNRSQGSLIHLALDHGVGVGTAHRALTDCRLLAELFGRMDPEQLVEMFRRGLRPKALYKGLQRFDDNQLAKDAGFKWNGDERLWTRTMATEDASTLPFAVQKLCSVSSAASDCVIRARSASAF